ncbi:MAG: 3-oxoacyl-ACP reductase FabG [Oscillospiraceae bacterium]|nr:3-oxoacyl-ACP reductase FabG [Oscillospiraceae bacterium]
MKKIVLITGASRGIGADIARVFAQNGYAVVLHYNKSKDRAEELCDLLRQNGCDAYLLQGDLSQKGVPQKIVFDTIEHFGKLDVLINNAGSSLVAPFLDTSDEAGETLIKTDLTAAIECAKYAAADMVRRKNGKIINISSVWGISGASCEVYYSAAKAGIIGFTKALASELAPSGVQVNAIAPGVIDTEMNNNLSQAEKAELIGEIPAGRIGSGYDIAKAALFLASADADYITGQVLNVSGGFLI